MTEILRARVFGKPKPQPRARAFKPKGGNVRMYDPSTAEGWKNSIALSVKDQIPSEPINRAVEVEIEFAFPRPKSHVRANGKLKDWAPRQHTAKPDVDNLVKAVMDAFTSIGVWVDDTIVTKLTASKIYEDGPTIIVVREA